MKQKAWVLGVLLVILVLCSSAAYSALWIGGGSWKVSGDDSCANEGLVCADWDVEGVKTGNCCIDPAGVNTGDPGACQSRIRHPD